MTSYEAWIDAYVARHGGDAGAVLDARPLDSLGRLHGAAQSLVRGRERVHQAVAKSSRCLVAREEACGEALAVEGLQDARRRDQEHVARVLHGGTGGR